MKVFTLFDDDSTGSISFRNLKRVAAELGENLTDEELQEMIDEADRDGDGLISEEEVSRFGGGGRDVQETERFDAVHLIIHFYHHSSLG